MKRKEFEVKHGDITRIKHTWNASLKEARLWLNDVAEEGNYRREVQRQDFYAGSVKFINVDTGVSYLFTIKII